MEYSLLALLFALSMVAYFNYKKYNAEPAEVEA